MALPFFHFHHPSPDLLHFLYRPARRALSCLPHPNPLRRLNISAEFISFFITHFRLAPGEPHARTHTRIHKLLKGHKMWRKTTTYSTKKHKVVPHAHSERRCRQRGGGTFWKPGMIREKVKSKNENIDKKLHGFEKYAKIFVDKKYWKTRIISHCKK